MLKSGIATSGLLLALACDSSPSDTVHAFLEATRNHDVATLASVSVVGWPGEKVGTSDIEAWWIADVANSQVEPFQLDEWQRRLNAARARRDARLEETSDGEDTELRRIQSRVDRLRVQIEREREAARKSVETWTPIDGFQGGVETCEVEVILRSPSGDHHYALTLRQYRLSQSPEKEPIPSRWIVTAIEAVES